MTDIVIVNGARTAMGGFQGSLAILTAPELGAASIQAAIQRAGRSTQQISKKSLWAGVLPAGLKQGPCMSSDASSRLTRFSAGAVTINKLCGSGMKVVSCKQPMQIK